MALARTRRLAASLAALPLALVLAMGTVAHAQDAIADAFCKLLTPEEVGQALGDTVTADSSFGTCSWASDNAEGDYVYMSAYWDSLGFDERLVATEGTQLTVGGHQALFVPDLEVLYVDLDQGVLALQAVASAQDIDIQAALTQLGELAVSRGSTLPAPPSPPPPPSAPPEQHADPALEALFPDTVGGQPASVQSAAGSVLMASSSDESRAQTEAVLATQGKTVDDLTVAFSFAPDFSYSIGAFKVAGADAAALMGPLLAAQATTTEMTQAPGQVAGKNVTVVTSGGSQQYYYAKDDVIWVVTAQEPVLTEVFTALP